MAKQHSTPYLRKLSKSDLLRILENMDEYGQCTISRVRYILTDDRHSNK